MYVENPRAFPSVETSVHDYMKEYTETHPGMSLRDHFAGQALVGATMEMSRAGESLADFADGIAQAAYRVADAMLVERIKKGAAER